MPLLRRLAFVKQKPPSDLKPDEELFFCKFTNEVFRDYEAFFERTILCNSLVWTCKYTGRPGLTYQEALDSEARARRNLRTFPEALKRPVLFLATLTRRGRLADMCDDVFLFTKDRFFVGETVEVLFEDIRLQCTIVKVIPPTADKIKEHGNKSESEDLNTSNEENDKSKNFGPDASLYEYEVHDTKEDVVYVANGSDISRKKGLYTREKSKLFLKQHCDSYKCIWTVEDSSVKKLKLATAFQDLFAGPLPCFTTTPAKKRSPNDKELYQIMKEKKKVYEQLQEAERKKIKEKDKQREDDPKLSNEEIAIIKEKIKLEVEEARMKKKLEKEKEREKQREERRIRAEYLKEWNRPRDDLECDDLKDLPKPKPVKTVVPPELFGDMVTILEFLHVFGDYLEIEDEFPRGVSFEILERALIEKDIHGPMCDLLHLLLGVIFRLQEEEDENEEEDDTDVDSSAVIDTSELGEDELDRSKTLNHSLNSSTLVRPQLYLGKPVRTLPLDNCTVTEVLRLHLVCSGSRTTSSNAKFRYQQRGGFTTADDPGLDFKLKESALLQRLAAEDVYILPPEDKLKILTCLCQQLLTYVSARDLIEDSCERIRLLRIELKQLQWAESRREREEAHARYLHRLEQRAKRMDSDSKMKKTDEIMEGIDSFQEVRNKHPTNNSIKEERNNHLNSKNENDDSAIESDDEDVLIIDEELTPEETEKLRVKQAKARSKLKEQFLIREKEILEDINETQAITNIVPIGRDRAYRRFWQFKCLHGLFVEDADEFKGNCLGVENEANDILSGTPIKSEIKSEDDKSTNSDKENESFNGAINNIVHTTPVIMNGTAHLPHNTLISIDKPIINSHIWPKPQPNVYGCTGTRKNCPIHGYCSDRMVWGFYSSAEELDSLIDTLNPRGFREGPLRELFICEKKKLIDSMSNCPLDKEDRLSLKHKNCKKETQGSGEPKLYGEEALEWMLRDMLLDIEERLYSGSLGTVKVQNRLAWKAALENKIHSKLIDSNEIQIKTEIDESNPVVKQLAQVLIEIVLGVESKYLKPPLGDAEEKRPNRKADNSLADQKKLKKKPKEENNEVKEEDEDVTDAITRTTKTMLEKWQESLKAATSLSQIFLHLSTLERCVTWSRSALNARCRICRRKGDAEHMLLCDGCNRGHHMYCLKPPMKVVPEEDWFCTDCRPKVVHKPPRKKRFSEESDEEYSSKEESKQSFNDDIYDASTEENSLNDSSQMYTDGGGDLCAVCSTGGTLILCDRCPLAFHLKCTDPPLKKVPRGKWKCQMCTGIADKRGSRERLKPSKSTTKLSKSQKLEKREAATTRNKLKKHKSELGNDSSYRISPGNNKRKRLDSSDSPENDSSKKRSPAFDKKSRLNQSSDEDSDKNGIVHRSKGKKCFDTNDASRRLSIGLRGSDEGRDIKLCEDLLAEMCKRPESWPFLLPVNKKDVPDYHVIIEKPMDFATMRAKMNNLRYLSAADFLADARLIFKNCETYNMPTAPEYKAGVRLLKFLERRVHDMKLQTNSPTSPPNNTLKNSEVSSKRCRMI